MSKLFIWAVKKRAPFCKGTATPVFAENSSVSGEGKDVSARVEENKHNIGKIWMGQYSPAFLIDLTGAGRGGNGLATAKARNGKFETGGFW